MKNLLKILAIALCIPAIIQARFWMCPNDAQKYATRAEAHRACGEKAYYHSGDEAKAGAGRMGERGSRGLMHQAGAGAQRTMGGGGYDDTAEVGSDMDDTY